jgi:hypothetical protein
MTTANTRTQGGWWLHVWRVQCLHCLFSWGCFVLCCIWVSSPGRGAQGRSLARHCLHHKQQRGATAHIQGGLWQQLQQQRQWQKRLRLRCISTTMLRPPPPLNPSLQLLMHACCHFAAIISSHELHVLHLQAKLLTLRAAVDHLAGEGCTVRQVGGQEREVGVCPCRVVAPNTKFSRSKPVTACLEVCLRESVRECGTAPVKSCKQSQATCLRLSNTTPVCCYVALQVDVVATLDAPLPTVSRGMATRLVRDRQVCVGVGAKGKGGCW